MAQAYLTTSLVRGSAIVAICFVVSRANLNASQ